MYCYTALPRTINAPTHMNTGTMRRRFPSSRCFSTMIRAARRCSTSTRAYPPPFRALQRCFVFVLLAFARLTCHRLHAATCPFDAVSGIERARRSTSFNVTQSVISLEIKFTSTLGEHNSPIPTIHSFTNTQLRLNCTCPLGDVTPTTTTPQQQLPSLSSDDIYETRPVLSGRRQPFLEHRSTSFGSLLCDHQSDIRSIPTDHH